MSVNDTQPSPLRPRRPVGRRQLLVGLAVAPVLAALLVACGSQGSDTADTAVPDTTVPDTTVPDTTVPDTTVPDTTMPPTTVPEPIAHPTTADSIILQVKIEGGFVPPGVNFAQLPDLLIAGDGAVYQPAPTTREFPGPLVLPVQVATLTEDGIQTVLRLAEELGLLDVPPDYTGAENVADAPDTVVTINAGGSGYVHSAYGLGLGLETEGEESSPARQALLDFVTQVQGLETLVGADELGDPQPFEPAEYRFQSLPLTEANVEAMDPDPVIVNWPEAAGIALRDATECAVLPAETIGAFFEELESNTVLHEGDGETASFYQLAAVSVLPGDPGC